MTYPVNSNQKTSDLNPAQKSRRRRLDALVEKFQQYLHLPDPGSLLILIGTVTANRLEGPPVWLLIVGVSSGGKTEELKPISALPDVHELGNVTEAGLLSGTSKKDCVEGATGGVLRKLGTRGILCCKDFTTVLSAPPQKRASLLAAFREIYDGSWTRNLGNDGGTTLVWHGKAGLVGGVTPVIDKHHGFMNVMGERFVLWRLTEIDEMSQCEIALDHAGSLSRMQDDLEESVLEFFRDIPHDGTLGKGPEISKSQREYLKNLALVITHGRSTVIRDNYSREVELIVGPEGPGRVIKVLDRLRAGLQTIGLEPDEALHLLRHVAFSCMPVARSGVLRFMASSPNEAYQIKDLAGPAAIPPNNVLRRHLENLESSDLLRREPPDSAPGVNTWWYLTERAVGFFEAIGLSDSAPTETSPDKSPPPPQDSWTPPDKSPLPPKDPGTSPGKSESPSLADLLSRNLRVTSQDKEERFSHDPDAARGNRAR